MPRLLTPEALIRLYSRIAPAGGPLGSLIQASLSVSPQSRKACRHLLPLFEGDRATEVTIWEVYLVHYRHAGQERWRQLASEALPAGEILPALWSESEHLRWGLAEGICETSRQRAALDPGESLILADMARQIAGEAPTSVAGERARKELLALTWACTANAHRNADQLEDARGAMLKVKQHLEEAHPALLGLVPGILSISASLAFWEGEYQRALEIVAEALEGATDERLRARLLVQEGNLLVTLGERADSALEPLRQALPLIDRKNDPRLWFAAAVQQLLILTELGRLEEAEAFVPEVQTLIQEGATPVDAIQVRWIEARLAAGQGYPARSEALYREVQEGYLQHRMAYCAAVVTLEHCEFLLKQGRLEEVKIQAAGTLVEFRRQKVEPRFLSALALVEQAVLGQRLTLEVLTKARGLLDRRVDCL